MAVSDLLVGLGSFAGGFAKGQGQRQQMDLERAKQNQANAKATADLGNEGYRINPETGEAEIDPGFSDPTNPSYQRAASAAKFKAMGGRANLANPLSLADVWAIRNPGQPLPDSLAAHADKPYAPQYDGLFTTQRKPGLDILKPERARALEGLMKWAPGTADGMTEDNFEKLTSNVTANKFAADKTANVIENENRRSNNVIENENKRNQNNVDAANARQGETIEHQTQAPLNAAYAKDYNEYTSGGRSAAAESISKMREVAQQLRNHQAPGGDLLSDINAGATRIFPGTAKVLDPDLAEMKTIANKASASSLKALLGGRGMTNQDVKLGLGFDYNPNLSPAQNADLLEATATAHQGKMKEQDKKALFYEKNNHNLKGYKSSAGGGVDETGAEEDGADAQSPTKNPSDVRAEQARKGRVAVNGGGIPAKQVADLQKFPTRGATAGTPPLPKQGDVVEGKRYIGPNSSDSTTRLDSQNWETRVIDSQGRVGWINNKVIDKALASGKFKKAK